MADSNEEGEGTRRATSANREGGPHTPPNEPEPYTDDLTTEDPISSTSRLIEICSDIGRKINEVCRNNRGEPAEEDRDSDESLHIDDSVLIEIHDLVDGLKEMNDSIRRLEKSYIKLATRSHQVTEDIDTLKKRLHRLKRAESDSDRES